MKNYYIRPAYGFLALFLLGSSFFSPLAFSQILQAIPNDSKIDITAALTDHIDPTSSPHETSVGLFYRLDGVDTKGKSYSYFWPASIVDSSDNTQEFSKETLNLPNGTYSLTAYQARKGGPIKSAPFGTVSSEFVINSDTNTHSFPSIFLGNSEVKLFSSWNISTTEFPNETAPNPPHNTYVDSDIPDENIPWVFMTVVKKNWPSNFPIIVTYPDFLANAGAIFENCMLAPGVINGACPTSLGVSFTDDAVSHKITVQKNSSSVTQKQVVIHLIFKKNPSYLPITNPNSVSFGVGYYIGNETASAPVLIDTTFTFHVKETPHDPNSLEVDKKELCECGTDEYLKYRIDYQNDGAAPTDTVTVTLFNTTHLITDTIQHEQHTRGWNAPINPPGIQPPPSGPNQFIIDYYGKGGLPGLKQNSASHPKVSAEACSDYFYIQVKKEDCLPAGTVIQPRAEIVFAGATDTIYTNLDETMIVSRLNCKPCPPNRLCPKCSKKKTCWLLNLFRRKRN